MNNREYYKGYTQALTDTLTYLNFINLGGENIGYCILDDVENMLTQSKQVLDTVSSRELQDKMKHIEDSLENKAKVIDNQEFNKLLNQTTSKLGLIKPKWSKHE